ncbi:EF-P 5-aminopentanol modification-associated protein YfmF [Oceanobacillus luteolus]|uniref:EF-P 5-aminopentanol modification-associated protein YfmF n=1 Tax=Oceanobacillus luteolus TaxID=1274358 RepID=A0ABW4HQE1_9BACI
MNLIEEQTVNKNGYHIHFIPTKKFKTLTFVIKSKAPLNKDTITKRALLPNVLREATKNYPSRTELQLKLDDLYGAVLSVDGAKKGEDHIISFRLEVANQRYLPEKEEITEEALQLLSELIFAPHLENNSFAERIVNREKASLKQRIQAIRDDKIRYANMRLIEEMCEGEAYSIHVNGYEDELETITGADLFAYYKEMVKTDEMDIYVVGDMDPQYIEEAITTIFERDSINKAGANQTKTEKQVDKPKEIIEKEPIQQAKLHIGYRTNTVYSDKEYPALQVFNGLFGGFPSSKLFMNVREKNSLAYYASSQVESHKGLLFVFSGIAPEDYEKARDIIREQMQEMKAGNFTEQEMNEAKDMIIHYLRETMDNNHGLVELFYQQKLANYERTLEEIITKISAVTKEEVVRVGEKIQEDTLYLLTSEGGN